MTSGPSNNEIRLHLPSRLELLGVVDKIADGVTEHLEFEDVDKDAVAISVIEACTNAIQHGHREDPDRFVNVVFRLDGNRLTITVEDEGAGFEPGTDSEMTPPDLLATRGRGIFIMRSMMDEVEFDFTRGTRVRLVKHKSASSNGGKGEGSSA